MMLQGGMAPVCVGSLDAFRQQAIHTRFGKTFLTNLELARAYALDPFGSEEGFSVWNTWREMLGAAERVASEYPVAASPARLVDELPLAAAASEIRARLRERAQQEFEDKTNALTRCLGLLEQLKGIRQRAERIDLETNPQTKLRMLDDLLPDLRSLFESLEALDYGVWIP